MPRKTIFVSDALEERMKHLREKLKTQGKEDVNWSKVACDAFEVKLREFSKTKPRTSESLALDCFIAEEFMGWKIVQTDWTERTGQTDRMFDAFKDDKGKLHPLDEVPTYSTNEAVNVAVIEAARKREITFTITPHGKDEWLVRGFFKGSGFNWRTAPERRDIPAAVCEILFDFVSEAKREGRMGKSKGAP